MSADERLVKTSDEDLAGTDRGPTGDDVRGHHEEAIVAQGATATNPPASAAEAASVRDRNRPAGDRSAAPRREERKDRALFDQSETERLRSRWNDIQGRFVDEPREAVAAADALVADVMKRLSEMFANERAGLERQWDRGDKVTTEDLRLALQRYHTFFDRLLAV
jgi:hypothetical protein